MEGQCLKFNGNLCRHFTKPNQEGRTRVSFDLRCIPASCVNGGGSSSSSKRSSSGGGGGDSGGCGGSGVEVVTDASHTGVPPSMIGDYGVGYMEP